EKALTLLSLESPAPIVRDGPRWQLTAAPLSEGFWDRARRLTELRRAEQQQMLQYVALESGHMDFLIRALDGQPATQPPRSALAPLPATYDPTMGSVAVDFLRRSSLPLKPREKWPNGGMLALGVQGSIPAALRAETGKALCVF